MRINYQRMLMSRAPDSLILINSMDRVHAFRKKAENNVTQIVEAGFRVWSIRSPEVR
jgi:hypothetical protein